MAKFLTEVNKKEKKPLRIAVKSLAATQNNLNRQLAETIVLNINSLPDNYLQALLFFTDTASHFLVDKVSPSRACVASRVDCSTKTVSRATNRLQGEGFIKKKNETVHIKKDVCRNKFTEIDVTPFRNILHFIYKHLPKKHHALILAFSALRVINISSVPDVNIFININTKSIDIYKNETLVLLKKKESNSESSRSGLFPKKEEVLLTTGASKPYYVEFCNSEQDERAFRHWRRITEIHNEYCRTVCGLFKKIRRMKKENEKINYSLLNYYNQRRLEVCSIVRRNKWELKSYPKWMMAVLNELNEEAAAKKKRQKEINKKVERSRKHYEQQREEQWKNTPQKKRDQIEKENKKKREKFLNALSPELRAKLTFS